MVVALAIRLLVGPDNPALIVRETSGLAPFLECDGCLVLGRERALLERAVETGRAGKRVWRNLAEIPK